jgi:peptidoglycan/xylan/chitin deacetylase (PgdA/CDA1 family)
MMTQSNRHMDRGCFLIFHRAIASAEWDSMPNRGFHLDLSYLERLIRYIQRSGWDIVSMDEALNRLANPGHRRFVNISLDDGYRDTAEQVVPLFARLGAPITLFITTGIPDRILPMRNASLETILRKADSVTDDGRIYVLQTPKQRRKAYHAISARWEAEDGDAAYVRFCAGLGEDPDQLDDAHRITWPMLERMRDTPGVEIGAHTVMHRRIAPLDPADAMAELAGSRTRLQEKLGVEARHFAFPYGQPADCGERDFDLARQAGYASAATTVKAIARPGVKAIARPGVDPIARPGVKAIARPGGEAISRPGANPHALPRHTINGTHRNLAFAQMHLSGFSAWATSVLRRG